MIIIAVGLLLAGFLLKIAILKEIGIAALILGLAIIALGYAGHPVGGRRNWY